MLKVVNNLSELIGKTPLYRSRTMSVNHSDVLLKLEMFNPMKHIADRTAKGVVAYAEQEGILQEGREVLDSATDNYGLSLAFYAGAHGYPVSMVVPESSNRHFINTLKASGVSVILSDAMLGVIGAQSLAEEIVASNPETYVMLSGFNSMGNLYVHQYETAPEIWAQTNGKIDTFIASYYSGGIIAGIGKYLKKQNPNVKIVLAEAEKSAVFSGGTASEHNYADIAPGFKPELLDDIEFDDIIVVSEKNALACQRLLATKEGLSVGYASALQACAAHQYAEKHANECIVTIAHTYGERFISTLEGKI